MALWIRSITSCRQTNRQNKSFAAPSTGYHKVGVNYLMFQLPPPPHQNVPTNPKGQSGL